jgi:hypothetical protein
VPTKDGRGYTLERRNKPDLRSLARLEQLLMQLEGTGQARKVDVDLRMNEAAAGALFVLTPEQVQTMLTRRAETHRLADLGRRQLPATVTVVAESSHVGAAAGHDVVEPEHGAVHAGAGAAGPAVQASQGQARPSPAGRHRIAKPKSPATP